MKAIIIKINETPFYVEQVREITTADYLKLQKQAEEHRLSEERIRAEHYNRIYALEQRCSELEKECQRLMHEIRVDRGEEEPEPTGTCYTEDGQLEEVYFDPNEEPQPELAEETTEVSE